MKYPCSIERYYHRALKQLGHKVYVDKEESLYEPPQNFDLSVVVKWCRHPYFVRHPNVLIFTDHTSRFKEYYDSIKDFFDYIFLVHNEPFIDHKKIHYLPVAYDPQEHQMLDRQKNVDCIFIGTYREEREFLRDIPIINRYGNNWGDTRDIYGDDYRDLCSRAKIIVNSHYKNDDTNMRDYEAPNFHAMILTDKTPFTPDRDVVLYKGKEDLEEKIGYYLDHEEERQKIAEHGYKTITEGKYTYKNRMEEMLKIIGCGK
jgi:hypothetical protein